MAWLGKHPNTRVVEIAQSVMGALKEQGVVRFGAVGYCFGARVSFDLAFNNELDVVAVSHPSLLKIPDDLEVRFSTARSYAWVWEAGAETDGRSRAEIRRDVQGAAPDQLVHRRPDVPARGTGEGG